MDRDWLLIDNDIHVWIQSRLLLARFEWVVMLFKHLSLLDLFIIQIITLISSDHDFSHVVIKAEQLCFIILLSLVMRRSRHLLSIALLAHGIVHYSTTSLVDHVLASLILVLWAASNLLLLLLLHLSLRAHEHLIGYSILTSRHLFRLQVPLSFLLICFLVESLDGLALDL